MFLNENHSRARTGNHFSDMFPIRNDLKQGDCLSPFLFNFALDFAIRRVQENQQNLKLNGTHQLTVYTDDINVQVRSLYTTKKNTEAVVIVSKEVCLEVNAEKTKYVVMSREQNAGQNCNIKTDNKIFESAEHFGYLGTTLKNQNSIQEEIKSRLDSGNACYRSVQNLLSPVCYSKILRYTEM